MRMKRHQITHILKKEAKNAPLSQTSLPKRWQLSRAPFLTPYCIRSSSPKEERTQGGGEGYQCWELQGGSALGEVPPAFPFGEKRSREQRRALRASPVKILGACKKGQMAFHFLERCSLLICPGPCMQGTRAGVVERVRIHVAWWERCEGFLWVKETTQKVATTPANRAA